MRRKRMILVLLIGVLLLALSGCGNKEEGNPFDFSGIETKDLNPWNYMENMELSMRTIKRPWGIFCATWNYGRNYGNCIFYLLHGIENLFYQKCCYQRRDKTGGSSERNDCNYVVQHSVLARAI